MIDRKARNDMLALVDDYLAGNIKSFDFDNRLQEIDTDDRTVREIAYLSWFSYDDLIDHPAKLTRPAWNFFQRLRLILQSDAEIKQNLFWNFTPLHRDLSIAIPTTAAIYWFFDAGPLFFLTYAAFGILLAFRQHEQARAESPAVIPSPELIPFASFSSLREVYESTPNFRKMPYRTMDLTPLRSTIRVRAAMLPWLIFWPMRSLIALLTVRQSQYEVTLLNSQRQ